MPSFAVALGLWRSVVSKQLLIDWINKDILVLHSYATLIHGRGFAGISFVSLGRTYGRTVCRRGVVARSHMCAVLMP